MSTFNWKKIISIHKEIVKRGEDNFFSIPLNENLGFRSTYFENLDFLNPSGPWNISLDQIKNSTITCVDTWEGSDENKSRGENFVEVESEFNF